MRSQGVGRDWATFTYTFQRLKNSGESLLIRTPGQKGTVWPLLRSIDGPSFLNLFFFLIVPEGTSLSMFFPNHSPPWKCNATKILYIWLSISVLCTSKTKISFTHTPHPTPLCKNQYYLLWCSLTLLKIHALGFHSKLKEALMRS